MGSVALYKWRSERYYYTACDRQRSTTHSPTRDRGGTAVEAPVVAGVGWGGVAIAAPSPKVIVMTEPSAFWMRRVIECVAVTYRARSGGGRVCSVVEINCQSPHTPLSTCTSSSIVIMQQLGAC